MLGIVAWGHHLVRLCNVKLFIWKQFLRLESSVRLTEKITLSFNWQSYKVLPPESMHGADSPFWCVTR